MFSTGGHAPFFIGLTTPGNYGEVSPHPLHPGAVRDSVNHFFVRANGGFVSQTGGGMERWDGTTIYSKELNLTSLFTGSTWNSTIPDNTTVIFVLKSYWTTQNTFLDIYDSNWNLLASNNVTGWSWFSPAVNNPTTWYGGVGLLVQTSYPTPPAPKVDVTVYNRDANGVAIQPFPYVQSGDPNYVTGELNNTLPSTAAAYNCSASWGSVAMALLYS